MPDFIQNFDKSFIFYLQNNLHNAFLDKLMFLATFLGDKGLIWLAICIILLLTKKYRKVGLMGICALFLSMLFSEYIIKLIVHRPRPFIIYPHNLLITKPEGYSFPSSHSAESFAAAAILYKSFKKYGFIFIILAILIAFSRVYLFVHFPSDVIAGSILGLLCGYFVYIIFKPKTQSE